MLISQINISFFFAICISSNMIFYFKITLKYIRKQTFSALDIVESRGKEMWLVSYVNCDDIIAQFFLIW